MSLNPRSIEQCEGPAIDGATARSRFIHRADGPMLNIREWGSGEDICLLIHGFGEGSYIWDEIAPRLASFCRVMAIDLRGHGESAWDPAARYATEDYLADVTHCIDVIDTDRVIIVGHSLGANIGIRLAASRSTKVRGLVVVDFGPDRTPEGSARVRSDFNESARRYRSTAEYECWLAAKRPLVSRDLLVRIARCALRADPQGGLALKADPALGRIGDDPTKEAIDARNLWGLVAQLRCPMLVMRGVVSAVLSQQVAEKMIQVAYDARLQVVNFAGHAVMTDNPADFERYLRLFMSEVLRA